MSMNLTPGKLAGLKAVSDSRGVIAAAAMDQRGSLKKSLAKEKGVAEVPDSALEEFKSLVTEVLTKHASAILLDPEFGLPASRRRNGKGLLLAYEKTGYDAALPGRLPDLLDLWSVRRLKEAGADCIKILLYYTPYENSRVNDLKHAWVERIADECRAHDIPFFLELVGYGVNGEDEKSVAYAKRKPDIVTGSMEEFGKQRYGVDVLKVEVPIQMEFVVRHQILQGRTGLHPRRSPRSLPPRRLLHAQALHLSLRRRLQPRLHRDPRVSQRIRRPLQRRPLRPRHLERRHRHLRKARRKGLRGLAPHQRRREHRERQQSPQIRPQLVRQGQRPGPGIRVFIKQKAPKNAGAKTSGVLLCMAPLLAGARHSSTS